MSKSEMCLPCMPNVTPSVKLHNLRRELGLTSVVEWADNRDNNSFGMVLSTKLKLFSTRHVKYDTLDGSTRQCPSSEGRFTRVINRPMPMVNQRDAPVMTFIKALIGTPNLDVHCHVTRRRPTNWGTTGSCKSALSHRRIVSTSMSGYNGPPKP